MCLRPGQRDQDGQEHKVKTAFGTDMLFDPEMAKKQGKFPAKLNPLYTPYEALEMATNNNAQLLKLCGPLDPYPGELGTVAEDALADWVHFNFLGDLAHAALANRRRAGHQRLLCTSPTAASIRVAPGRLQR